MLYDQPIIKKKFKNKPPEPSSQEKKTKKEIKRLTHLNQSEEEKLIEEGRKEGIKEIAKKEIESLPRLRELERMQDRELMRIKTVFPFVFFSDQLVIEENKLTFVWSIFFWSKDVRSILIKDIANVTVASSLFFASLNVVDQYFAKDPMTIKYLPKRKALEARRLIQGLIVSTRENIDYADVPKHDVIKHAMKLGETDTKR